ncbi:MAG: SDR family oxidoreductase [Gemmatimonadota bacterium]
MSVMDTFSLDGRVAVVTGASFGLGASMALGLAEAGADVAGISREVAHLEAIRQAVEAAGRAFLGVACDVADRAALRAAIHRAHAWQGRLDVLVNNAGIIERAPAAEYPEWAWDQVLRVNLDAVWFGSQEAGRLMLAQGGGKIISTASVLSFSGGILVPGYAAAKGAIAQLTKALANEWAARGINVNAIAPGYFATRSTSALREDAERARAILQRIPAGRWGVPEDLKGAVVFLASRASDYIHGHLLVVDGGWCAR